MMIGRKRLLTAQAWVMGNGLRQRRRGVSPCNGARLRSNRRGPCNSRRVPGRGDGRPLFGIASSHHGLLWLVPGRENGWRRAGGRSGGWRILLGEARDGGILPPGGCPFCGAARGPQGRPWARSKGGVEWLHGAKTSWGSFLEYFGVLSGKGEPLNSRWTAWKDTGRNRSTLSNL